MNKLIVIKIGGNIIDNELKLNQFVQDLAQLNEPFVLVHGGGKLATDLANKLNIPQQLIDGRRITDAETLKIATMTYAGFINKNIVAQLQANGNNAIGFTGADANLIRAHKRLASASKGIDYGFVGDVDEVNVAAIKRLTDQSVLIEIMNMTEGYMRNWRDDNNVPVHIDMRELARERLSELD